MAAVGDIQLDPKRGNTRRWVALIVAAVLVRVGIAAISIGTNDARLFFTFADEIRQFGIVPTYGLDGLFNHPPLIGAWIEAAAWLAGRLPHPLGEYHAFSFIFKLPIIAADSLCAYMVWQIWRRKLGDERAAAVAAAAACSLCGILVSAYHCNTDPLYAALCLAAVYLMEERKAFLLAGFALAAAINVKIVPVLLIPGLLLSCSSVHDARRFLAGLAAGIIPFLPVLAGEAPSFVHNVLAYNSSINNWGLTLFLLAGKLWHGNIGATSPAAEAYHDLGRYLLFAMIGAWAVVARLAGRWTRYEIAAVTFAIFLCFTPGFGIQYVVIVAPLMFAVRPGIAFVYATAAGAFAASLYITQWTTGTFPLQSDLGRFPLADSMLGLIAWGVLIRFLALTIGRKPAAGREECPTGQPPAAPYTSARAA
jgi:hypothetical protein